MNAHSFTSASLFIFFYQSFHFSHLLAPGNHFSILCFYEFGFLIYDSTYKWYHWGRSGKWDKGRDIVKSAQPAKKAQFIL